MPSIYYLLAPRGDISELGTMDEGSLQIHGGPKQLLGGLLVIGGLGGSKYLEVGIHGQAEQDGENVQRIWGKEVGEPEGSTGGERVLEWDTVKDGLEVANLSAGTLSSSWSFCCGRRRRRQCHPSNSETSDEPDGKLDHGEVHLPGGTSKCLVDFPPLLPHNSPHHLLPLLRTN